MPYVSFFTPHSTFGYLHFSEFSASREANPCYWGIGATDRLTDTYIIKLLYKHMNYCTNSYGIRGKSDQKELVIFAKWRIEFLYKESEITNNNFNSSPLAEFQQNIPLQNNFEKLCQSCQWNPNQWKLELVSSRQNWNKMNFHILSEMIMARIN